jgi:exopolyphosphatase/guanosine-5'-triphosphate,3'-diphosphate pyrophosphatase
VLSAAVVARWCDTLAAEPAAARRARPGMVEGRQDVIVGGALVLRAVMARFGFPEVLVSESDILDGLIASQRAPLPG